MAEQNKKLVEQSEALTDFFESLMQDVQAYRAQEEELAATHTPPVTKVREQVEEAEAQSKPVAEPIVDTSLFETLPPVAPEVVAPVTEPKVTPRVTEQVVNETEQKEPETQPHSHDLPAWSENEFQAMLFKVAGLTMAVPLVDLNGVIECRLDDVTAMPGHADFYFGLLSHLGKNIPLVDTARFVLPADKLSTLTGDQPQKRITRAVLIQDSQYGLACDEVNQVITLKPDMVRWRSQRTQRRWLAGTVVEHMCALIDACAFAELLAARAPIQAFRS